MWNLYFLLWNLAYKSVLVLSLYFFFSPPHSFLFLLLSFCLAPRLRALSSGGSVTSPPPSPAMPKYKLAEYRYGREEMLALYIKDNKVSEQLPNILQSVLPSYSKRSGFTAANKWWERAENMDFQERIPGEHWLAAAVKLWIQLRLQLKWKFSPCNVSSCMWLGII